MRESARPVSPKLRSQPKTSNIFLEIIRDILTVVSEWSFLTNHAWVLLCIAHDPGVRLRDIAARVDISERAAYGIVTDLTEAGYVVKAKDGRRNRYQIQAHLPLRRPLPVPVSRERTIGEILALLTGADDDAAGLPGRDEGPVVPLADGGQAGTGEG
jgi:Winged helix DNA-binding domain